MLNPVKYIIHAIFMRVILGISWSLLNLFTLLVCILLIEQALGYSFHAESLRGFVELVRWENIKELLRIKVNEILS